MASPRIEEKRVEVRSNFEALDSRASDIEDRVVQMRFLRQIAAMKAETTPLMREPGELRAFAEKDDSGRYRGIDASTEQRAAEKQQADDRVRALAARYGVDGGATVERHAGPPPSRGLARQFAEAEADERNRSRAARGEAAETPEQRQAVLSKMHTEIRAIYQQSRERLEDRAEARTSRPEPARTVRPEPTRPAAPVSPAQSPTQPRTNETGEDLPDRVKARMAKDAQRAGAAQRVWEQREAEHQRAMERPKTEQRPQEEPDSRKRGDEPDDETRRRGRKR